MSEVRSAKSMFTAIQVIYGALIMGVVLLSLAIYFLVIDTPVYSFDIKDTFTLIISLLTVAAPFFSTMLFKSQISKIDPKDTLAGKLAKYQSATLIKGAVLEAPALIASVIAMQTNNLVFFVFTGILVAVMYLKFPAREKFLNEVLLNSEEKSQFNKL